MTAGFDTGRRQRRGRSVQHRPRLGSQPVVGVEPAPLYTRHLEVVHEPPAHQRLPRADQAQFTAWARQVDVATVADLAVIAAAEEALDDAAFPPSPAFRVKWGRVAAWSPVLVLATVGSVAVARYVCHHPPLYCACAIVGAYFLSLIEPAGRR